MKTIDVFFFFFGGGGGDVYFLILIFIISNLHCFLSIIIILCFYLPPLFIVSLLFICQRPKPRLTIFGGVCLCHLVLIFRKVMHVVIVFLFLEFIICFFLHRFLSSVFAHRLPAS